MSEIIEAWVVYHGFRRFYKHYWEDNKGAVYTQYEIKQMCHIEMRSL